MNFSPTSLVSGAIGCEAHALDPEPCGFIIRKRRCALQPRTPASVARPNTPSPPPEANGCTNNGHAPAHCETARSSSARVAQIQLDPFCKRPSLGSTACAGRNMSGSSLPQSNASVAVLAMVVGNTLKPADRADAI